MMRKFRAVVSGQNFQLREEGSARCIDFRTDRVVKARTADEAKSRVIDEIWAEQCREGQLCNDPADPPVLFLESLQRRWPWHVWTQPPLVGDAAPQEDA